MNRTYAKIWNSFKFQQAGIETITSKSAMNIFDEWYANILKGALSLSLSLSVLAQVDSAGGSFSGFVKALCEGLAPMGVSEGNVTCTFRSVSLKSSP